MKQPTTIIGSSTTYDGAEHPFLRGSRVRIIGVMKGAASPGYDPEQEHEYIRDDVALERAGGVTAEDRLEVAPWIETEARWGWATSDARAIDLGCFRQLLGCGHLN